MPIVVLDSNVLHGRADPAAASELKPLMALAAQLDIPVAIPAPCLIELREGMRERLSEARRSLSDAIGEFSRLHVEVTWECIGEDEAVAQYASRLKGFLREHSVTVLPFPDRMPDVQRLFELAAKKEPPFDESGNSYRDAMIAMTVEHRAQEDGDLVLFVTNDARFKRSFTAKMLVCLKVDEAIRALEQRLSAFQQQARERVRDCLVIVLAARLDELTQEAEKTVRFWPSGGEPGSRVTKIEKFVAAKIASVEPGDTTGPWIDFTATVEGELSFSVMLPAHSLTREARASILIDALEEVTRQPTKVGEARRPVLLKRRTGGLRTEPSVEIAHATVTLAVEGDAVLEGDRITAVRLIGMKQEKIGDPAFR